MRNDHVCFSKANLTTNGPPNRDLIYVNNIGSIAQKLLLPKKGRYFFA
jgi:hypothetical protein